MLDPLIRWILIASGLLLVLAIVAGIVSWWFPEFRDWARDFAIILVAVFQMISAVIAVVLLVALLYAVKALNDLAKKQLFPKLEEISLKVDELLENTRAIGQEVRDSSGVVTTATTYAAERAVSPIIRVSSVLAGVRAAAGSLARRGQPSAADEPVGGVAEGDSANRPPQE